MPTNDLRLLMNLRAPDSLSQETYLPTLAAAFLLDRRAQNLTRKTIEFYRNLLQGFLNWCDLQAIKTVNQLTPDVIRQYLIHLEDKGINAGGVHARYRTLRAFLRWYDLEFEPADFRNPLRKVKPPRVDIEPLEPVPIEHVRAMLATCKAGKFTNERDKVILLVLLDTGVRAGELLALDRQDVDTLTGDIVIRKSKSRKPRNVFLGRQARRALRSYLRLRKDGTRPLFVTDEGERLKMAGLRQIILRRAKRAGVPPPSLHSFRRAFTLAMKRAGADLITIQKLLGHADLSQLIRYLAQTPDDLREAHQRGSPADNLI
ncbi:MAG TPA: tyrosine-type recombinase/integrase [Anaerolineales bacterium]|nr:tyrosine-type recombinase/integrase [Anaerolineales bacterium]